MQGWKEKETEGAGRVEGGGGREDRRAYCPAKSVISGVKFPLASTGQTDSPPI